MTADDFRKLALEIEGAVERSHVNHPDFRLRGKVFASLGSPTAECGMVKLTPEMQQVLVQKKSGAFRPAAGAWGKSGYTTVILAAADKRTVETSLEAAATNVLVKAKRKRAKP